jgi:hypothetical protein
MLTPSCRTLESLDQAIAILGAAPPGARDAGMREPLGLSTIDNPAHCITHLERRYGNA